MGGKFTVMPSAESPDPQKRHDRHRRVRTYGFTTMIGDRWRLQKIAEEASSSWDVRIVASDGTHDTCTVIYGPVVGNYPDDIIRKLERAECGLVKPVVAIGKPAHCCGSELQCDHCPHWQCVDDRARRSLLADDLMKEILDPRKRQGR